MEGSGDLIGLLAGPCLSGTESPIETCRLRQYFIMSVETFLAEYDQSTEPMFDVDEDPSDCEFQDMRHQRFYRGVVEIHLMPKNDAGEDVGPHLYLAFIGTHERGKGHGTAALTWLCDLGDRHGVTLVGHADSKTRTLLDMLNKRRTPGLGKKQLRAWYERHGFVFRFSDGTPTKTLFHREPIRGAPATSRSP